MGHLISITEYEQLKKSAKTNVRSQEILNALEQTLDYYKIDKKRSLVAECILQMTLIMDYHPEMRPKDAESKALFEMVDYFKGKK